MKPPRPTAASPAGQENFQLSGVPWAPCSGACWAHEAMPTAARSRPETVRPLASLHFRGFIRDWFILRLAEVFLRRRIERLLAPGSTEIIRRALVDGGRRRLLLIHLHLADRINRHR